MSTKYSDLNKIYSTSKLKTSTDDDDEDYEEENKSNLKFILFFVCAFFLIIIFLVSVTSLAYYLIIKPDKMKRNNNQKSEIFLAYNEKRNIQDYVDICMRGILLDNNKYSKIENPKISIITPVYNKAQYILRLLRSIQNQSFKDIEIIFCDDHSNDNSTLLIKQLQKDDNRIVLLTHEINKGTLKTRVDGANIAKGEYILFADPDDFLINNILEKAYKVAYKTNMDIIHFQACAGDFFNYFYLITSDRTTKPIYQPKLSDLMYYEKGYLHQTDYVIWGKLIKKEVFKEVINSISEYYLNQHMSLHEDGLLLFLLFRKAKSYIFIKEFGTLYYANINSTMMNIKKKERINKTVRDSFLYLEFMFEYTNNTLHEKNMAVHLFKILFNGLKDIFPKITSGFDYIYKILDLYLNCSIIINEDKKDMIQLKNDLKIRERNITLLIQ